MSRLFAKRLYQTPLLAVKPSPIFRLPTRCLNTSANVHSGSVPRRNTTMKLPGMLKLEQGLRAGVVGTWYVNQVQQVIFGGVAN